MTPPATSRALIALPALAVGLLGAFVLAPPAVTGLTDERRLTSRFHAAFVEYWGTGERDLTPGLESVVDAWFRYHAIKAVAAALLLAVLVALGAALWKAFLQGARTAPAGIAVTLLGLCSLALVMANVQGAAAPFASLLPMLLDNPPADGQLTGTLDQIRQRLDGGSTTPGLQAVIDDYAHYHAVLAVVAALVALVLSGVGVMAWKRFARTDSTDRRTRRAAGAFGALMLLSALAVAVVAGANTTVAADPVPGLVSFFAGGW